MCLGNGDAPGPERVGALCFEAFFIGLTEVIRAVTD